FGAYDSSRTTKIKAIYQKTRDGISSKDCIYYNNGPRCKANSYAYTQKTSTTVYLCNLYYGDPTDCSKTGESKEGTLLHEWSHAYGLIQDVAYGRNNCKNLAKDSPRCAIVNADNYGYYYCDAQ
uniref:Lysine-specific metallo-endopeptidase domain-containing protein n=1 Tax=Amphimedon queenslandica TaxID=400682 RepID=A0A1X7TB92_AMPQE